MEYFGILKPNVFFLVGSRNPTFQGTWSCCPIMTVFVGDSIAK